MTDREQDRERDSLTDIRAAFEHQYMADSRDPSMLEQFSTYTNGWQAATAAAVPPGHVVVPVSVAKDAERYRWIKATRYEHDPDDDPDSAWAKAWDEIEGMVGATGDIDSAIDRAMIAAAEGK